jgi:UDP-N-acetylmuramoyl-L-alanyl-D-glutamate--2,6-diaminopimelate ligase
VRVEPDRARAIELVVARAEPGDVVVIAGKGHEVEQVIGNVAVPFDDREVALGSIRRWLDARMNTRVNGATG